MFLFRIVGRIVVVTIGIALQVLVAVKSPATLRFVQVLADRANDALVNALPDAYAVWVSMVGADTIFVHLIFIIVTIIGVEFLVWLWRGAFSSPKR